MYQALYRKWRPQTFDEVLGQRHITETLKNQVKSGRLSHAYIFIGTRGTGKTTCARILARAVNCEHPVDGNPCGQCPACRGISDGTVMDVVELDAASNNGVDNVRALREEALFSPVSVRKRVYIIDEVHMLSTPAFNALLKILEEPPEHLMFILATTELQKVPATILSRCQRHSFRRIETEQIAEYLGQIAKKEGFDLRPDAAELIARLAEGGVRDALSLLDQCSASEKIDLEAVYSAMGLAGNQRIGALLDKVLRHDTAGALKDFSALWMAGKDPASFLGELSGLLRDILMLRVAPRNGRELLSGGYDTAALEGFARRMTTEELLGAMGTVQNALAGIKDVKNPRTAAELCLAALCESAAGDSVASLRARVSRLEEQVRNGAPVRAVPAEEPEEPGASAQEVWEDGTPEDPGAGEDELDPAAFQEEQPEDAFLRPGEREAARPGLEPERAPARGELSWKELCALAAPRMPIDVRSCLGDEKRIRGWAEENALHIETAPGFLYGRVNRPEVLKGFADAARELCGRELRVVLGEMPQGERPRRSLDELRRFSEVKFI